MAALGVEYGCKYVLEAPWNSALNLVKNSGFITNTENWSLPTLEASGVYSTDIARATPGALKLVSTVSGKDEYALCAVPVIAGLTYTVVAYCYTAGFQAGALENRGVLLYDGSASAQTQITKAEEGWTRHQVSLKITEGKSELFIRLYAPKGTVYWDDVWASTTENVPPRAVFNDSTDVDFVGMLSPETSGLDSAEVREDAQDATEADGGVHGNFFYGRRPVILQGTVLASSKAARATQIAKIKRASNALRADATLTWTPSGGSEVTLKLRRQQPVRFSKGFVKDFMIPLVSADAYIKGASVKTVYSAGRTITTAVGEAAGVTAVGSSIYWIDRIAGTGWKVYKANLDGTRKELLFEVAQTLGNLPVDIDVRGEFLYVADWGFPSIGRFNLNTKVYTRNFITTGIEGPRNIVSNATNLYWNDTVLNRIGRGTLAGGSLEQSWLTPGVSMRGLEIDATNVYWGEVSAHTIGRAPIATKVMNHSFITSPNNNGIYSVAVNAANVYWGEVNNSIGQAAIAGTGAKYFIKLPNESVQSVALDAANIYWTEGARVRYAALSPSAENSGDSESFPSIVIEPLTGTTNYTLKNVTTGATMTLEGVEGSAMPIRINFKNHSIEKFVSGKWVYGYGLLNFASSTWWYLAPGANQITITNTAGERTEATIEWQDTYL